MSAVPIGILTSNRIDYLDATLRSLSASSLPADAPVVLFTDGEQDKRSVAYYHTDKEQDFEITWPTDDCWHNFGLSVVSDNTHAIRGLQGHIPVVAVSAGLRLGVVEASRQAVMRLLDMYPFAPGAILLQDDVVFNVDWYDLLLATASNHRLYSPRVLGLLAGLVLNRYLKMPAAGLPGVVASRITAQCLYVPRYATEVVKFWRVPSTEKQQFDNRVCQSTRDAGLWAGARLPFVCQHIGTVSRVRPHWGWDAKESGRVGYHAWPPFAYADRVQLSRSY